MITRNFGSKTGQAILLSLFPYVYKAMSDSAVLNMISSSIVLVKNKAKTKDGFYMFVWGLGAEILSMVMVVPR